MFGNVRQIIGIKGFRETERSGATMTMKNHFSNRKKYIPQKQNDFPEILSQTEAGGDLISVESALLFLEGFLEARLDRSFQITENVSKPQTNWLKFSAQNQNTSLATKAYLRASEISKKLGLSADQHVEDNHSEELKSIYMIIKDLRILIDRGIKYLTIESDNGFLPAISSAINKAKQCSQL